MAAALGRRVSLDDVAAMLNASPSELLMPVDELIHADLLTECDGALMFGHDLILEAVRASLPHSVRRSLDRQAASVLLAGGALPVEVATQLAESAEPGDEVAISTLFRAAETLGPTDPGLAADLSQPRPRACPAKASLARAARSSDRGLAARRRAWRAGKSLRRHRTAPGAPPEQEAEVRLSIAGMFAISADVRAEEGRQALALPGLPANLRARHLSLLLHNLVTAGRIDDARAVLDEVTVAVQGCDDVAARFALELAESGLIYADGKFSPALEMVEMALRSGLDSTDDTREHLAYQWRCDILTIVDRLDDSLQMLTEAVASAQRDRQGWALNIFETGRGRQLLQMGRLADAAAALEEQLTVDMAPQIVSVLDAAGVVALGRVALHMGDPSLTRQAREIAQVMLGQSAPSVRRHAAWLLALQAMAEGDALGAHEWLCALGEKERMSIVPLFPMDVADEARLIHIALASQDEELAAHAAAAARMPSPAQPRHSVHRRRCRPRQGPAREQSRGPGRSRRTVRRWAPPTGPRRRTGGPGCRRRRRWLPRRRSRGIWPGSRAVRPGRSGLGRRQAEGPPEGIGSTAPPGCRAATGKRLGGNDRLRTGRGPAGRARVDESRGG